MYIYLRFALFVGFTILRCAQSQKSVNLIYTAMEDWNHAYVYSVASKIPCWYFFWYSGGEVILSPLMGLLRS
jgi:hypothetical protein